MENIKKNNENRSAVKTVNYVDIQLTVPAVNVRDSHSIDAQVNDVIDNKMTYKVLGNKNGNPIVTKGLGSEKGWLRLAPLYRRGGWISYDYCEVINNK